MSEPGKNWVRFFGKPISKTFPDHGKLRGGRGCSRDPSLRLRDHPGRVGGWQSVCWGGTPYFRLFNVIWYLPSPYYRLFNVGWYLPFPYYRLINVLWLPFLKMKKFRVPSLEKSLGYIPWKYKVYGKILFMFFARNEIHIQVGLVLVLVLEALLVKVWRGASYTHSGKTILCVKFRQRRPLARTEPAPIAGNFKSESLKRRGI